MRPERRIAVDRAPPDGVPDGGSSVRCHFYSPQWQQLLEVETPSTTSSTITRQEQQFWGLRGVDDAILRRIDADGNGSYNTAADKGYYQLTDSSFSVIAHVDATSGQVRQRMSYDGYGNLKVLLLADFNGDGMVTQADLDGFLAALDAGDPSADFDGDGLTGAKDLDPFIGAYIGTTGQLIPDEVRIGYGGYVRDRVTDKLLARQRWYEPVAGRWVSRDPAGYVDGLDLYLYVRGNPLSLVDPMGLAGDDPPEERKSLWDRLFGSESKSLREGRAPDQEAEEAKPAIVRKVEEADRAAKFIEPAAQAMAQTAEIMQAGFSVLPGAGEQMDAQTLANPNASAFDRAASGVSLTVNLMTGGLLPNYSAIKAVGPLIPLIGTKILSKGDEGVEALSWSRGAFRGGPHRLTSGPTGDGLASHHMPAKSVSGLGEGAGPAIQMQVAHHLQTSSHGAQGLAGAEYRAGIANMIADGRMRDAMATEIRDVRRVAGSLYNGAIREMLDYAKGMDWLNKPPRQP